MNILKEADKIVNDRSQEKERQYGDFITCMEKTAKIATLMGSNVISTTDAYNVLIALKLARQSHSNKEDNLLDACAYLGSLNNFLQDE